MSTRSSQVSPHAEDAARADGEAGLLGVADGFHPFFVGVGGDDLGVEVLRGFQVVVDPADAAVVEELGGLLGESSQCGAGAGFAVLGDFHEEGFEPLVSSARVGARPELTMPKESAFTLAAMSAAFRICSSARVYLSLGGRVVVGGLGAKPAVFRTGARLGGDDRAERDIPPDKLQPDLVGKIKQIVTVVASDGREGKGFVAGKKLAVEDFLSECGDLGRHGLYAIANGIHLFKNAAL